MILASHIIVSGLLGAQTGNYFLAAAVGLVSHYILDAIPHWDYYLSKEFQNRTENEPGFIKKGAFWREIAKVAVDALIGLILFFILAKFTGFQNIIYALVGAFFGILPDTFQLLYFLADTKILKLNYDLHCYLHLKKEPRFWPGISTQIAAIALVFIIIYYL